MLLLRVPHFSRALLGSLTDGSLYKTLVSAASKTRYHKMLSKMQRFNEDGILGNPDLDFVFHQLQDAVYCSSQLISFIRNHLFLMLLPAKLIKYSCTSRLSFKKYNLHIGENLLLYIQLSKMGVKSKGLASSITQVL